VGSSPSEVKTVKVPSEVKAVKASEVKVKHVKAPSEVKTKVKTPSEVKTKVKTADDITEGRSVRIEGLVQTTLAARDVSRVERFNGFLCIIVQGSTKLSPEAHMSLGFSFWYKKASNAKKESLCCTEP
jgi:D-ribose pyranose/furanose isomerase RbsD